MPSVSPEDPVRTQAVSRGGQDRDISVISGGELAGLKPPTVNLCQGEASQTTPSSPLSGQGSCRPVRIPGSTYPSIPSRRGTHGPPYNADPRYLGTY